MDVAASASDGLDTASTPATVELEDQLRFILNPHGVRERTEEGSCFPGRVNSCPLATSLLPALCIHSLARVCSGRNEVPGSPLYRVRNTVFIRNVRRPRGTCPFTPLTSTFLLSDPFVFRNAVDGATDNPNLVLKAHALFKQASQVLLFVEMVSEEAHMCL